MSLKTDTLQEQYMTLEPDGTATGCNPVFSGFDSHRRLFRVRLIRLFQRRTGREPSFGSWLCVSREWFRQKAV